MKWVYRLQPGHFFWRVCASLAVMVLAILMLLPNVDSGIKMVHIDKVYHVLAFLTITLLFQMAFIKTSRLVIVSLVTTFGMAIEIIQYHLPFRDFSWLDFAANSAGVLLAWLLFRPIDLKTKNR